jgi:addiction module RelE/StbE family toxin
MAVKNYKIRFTRKARYDLDEVFQYFYDQTNKDVVGDRILVRLEMEILHLSEFPRAGSYLQDELLRLKGYRKCVVENYIVLYLIDDQEQQVIIVRIIHGRRCYTQLL